MGRNINSKSQINVKQNNYSKKGDDLKNKSLKHKEKIEASVQVKAVPVTDNLYVSMNRKKNKEIIPNKRGNININSWDFRREYYILSDDEKIKEKFKNGRPRNIHKRGSKYKIRKLRKKHIREKPDRKRIKNQSKIARHYGECCVCLESKEMNSANTINCGDVPHVLCADCKEKIKDNTCPLCRSHPIDPNKTQMVTLTNNYFMEQMSNILQTRIFTTHEYGIENESFRDLLRYHNFTPSYR